MSPHTITLPSPKGRCCIAQGSGQHSLSRWYSSVNRILAQFCLLNLKWHFNLVSLAARCLGSTLDGFQDVVARCDDHETYMRTILELIDRNPEMILALRLNVWNRSRRFTSLMWLFCVQIER
jgi:hypothetical protein